MIDVFKVDQFNIVLDRDKASFALSGSRHWFAVFRGPLAEALSIQEYTSVVTLFCENYRIPNSKKVFDVILWKT